MNYRSLICASLFLTLSPACQDEAGDSDSSDSSTSHSTDADSGDSTESASSASGDGDTGDGDTDTGDGDGDSGDGDGDTGSGDGDAASGEELWTAGGHMQRCGMCHSQNGQYPPEALAAGLDEAAIYNQIVNGGEVMTPQVPDELSSSEAADIAAYLSTLN